LVFAALQAGREGRATESTGTTLLFPKSDPGQSRPFAVISSAVDRLRKRWREAIQDGYIVQEAAELRSLTRRLESLSPAVVLLDLELPGLGRIAGLPSIRRTQPAAKIMVLARCPEDGEAVAALKAGVSGYHARDIPSELLVKALDVVQQHEIWISRRLVSHLLDELRAAEEATEPLPMDVDGRLQLITARQRQIVALLSAGARNREIAQRLNLTERTVKAHLTGVFKKLGVSGRVDLALFAMKQSEPAHGERYSGALTEPRSVSGAVLESAAAPPVSVRWPDTAERWTRGRQLQHAAA
jgi:DNA-binding NarL/FixJ family response regulator